MNTSTLRALRTSSLQHASPRVQLQLAYHSKSTSCLLPSLRHYASNSATATQQTSVSKQALLDNHNSRKSLSDLVNGPESTLPAFLNLPTRNPNEAFFPKHALRLGKTYAGFYKTGVKSIWANFKAARPLQKTLDDKYQGSLQHAVSAGFLSRRDLQLLVRSWFDVKRVPLFALVFLLCGEFTPLVVMALSSVVPWTCRIPKQVEGDRKKLEARRHISFRNLTAPPPEVEGVETLNRQQLIHVSWSLGLSSSAWDWLGGQYPGLPDFILRKKVARRVSYLVMDDTLIRKAGGIKDMKMDEVIMALVERGVDVLGQSDDQLRTSLNCWLKSTEKWPVERLLLTRPSVWPVRPSSALARE